MSLIMEGLKRAQQLRNHRPGDAPTPGSHPYLPKKNVSFRKKRWLFGATGLIGLFFLIFFFGGSLFPPDTGGSRDPLSSPKQPDILPNPPEEPGQSPIRPSRDSQTSPALRRQPASPSDESSPPPRAPHTPSVRETPGPGREQGQVAKSSAEPGREEGLILAVLQSEDRGLPRDLPEGRPSGRPSGGPSTRDSGEVSRTAQPETLEVHPPPQVPIPPLKAEPGGNDRVSTRKNTDPPLPSAPPAGKAPQEPPPPTEEKISSRPIEVRQETRRETPSNSEALRQFNHAVTLHQRRETGKAVQAYRKAIELNPASVEAYNNLGLLFQELGESDQAEWAYRKSTEIDPGYVKAYNNLGLLFLLRGRGDEAMNLFQKALTIDPTHYESHIHLGVLYKKRGQIHKAIESYQRALSIQPLQAEAYYNLGLLYEQLENAETAVRHYRKFTQMASSTYPDLVSKVQKHMDRLMKKETGKKSE